MKAFFSAEVGPFDCRSQGGQPRLWVCLMYAGSLDGVVVRPQVHERHVDVVPEWRR